MAQSINLQITPSGVIPTIYASQFDVGREITFNLYDGATAYIPPAGSTIRFEGKKSDGNAFSYDCAYTDNVVTVILTDQMTVFAENVTCELRIADINANDIGTLNVILSVEKSPIDGDTSISDTEIPAIIELARAEQYNSEAWAEGTRNGVPVGPTDPTYQNNAKYYAEHSSASISNLSDTDIQNLTDGQILKYDSNSGKWVNDDETGGASSLNDLTNVNITTPTNNQVLKYDSVNDEWINGDAPSGGSGGSTVTITTSEPSLYGQAVTITDGQDTYTGTFSNLGVCEIQGVEITGTATVSSGAASASITMPYFGNYSVVLSLFSATVTVTFPYSNGATCTLSDGVTTLTATSSPMAFTVPNAGTWTATVTLDGQSKTDSATITSDGQTASLTIEYGTINLTYDDDFKGESITCVSGGTTITKTAPSGANIMVFYPPSTGSWTISGTVSGDTYYSTPNPVVVSSLSTSVSASLESLPNGSTVTPTDDIQTWLKCAGIRDKTTYTTLADVLNDVDTFIALCADSNASDYMARSTTWASGVAADRTAMQIVGKYGYCANALRNDNTWNTAINNSPYASYVPATPVVPVGTVIHSAVEDTTYYMEGGQSVPFCTIASGDTETVLASTIESLKNQTITLYSSVAKDPTNLSNDYSKSIRITPNVTEIYLMPIKSLYWWGYMSDDLEFTLDWTDSYPSISGTKNTNSISMAVSNSQICGLSTKTPKPINKFSVVCKGGTSNLPSYGELAHNSTKSYNLSTETSVTSTNMALYELNVTGTFYPVYYVYAGASKYMSSDMFAYWYE